MKIKWYALIFFLITTVSVLAQESTEERKDESRARSNSLNPAKEKESVRPQYKAKGKSTRRVRYVDPVQAYYDRMEQVARAYKRSERLSKKPQYSNPLYFGHKRPPKKHSPSKMKYCRECGIRH